MRSKLTLPLRLCLAGVFSLLAIGACGDDEDAAPGISGPTGPIELSIASIEGTAGASVPGDAAGDVTLGCDSFVHVRVDLKNWLLRPPNACAGAPQCGWLVLLIDPPEGGPALSAQSAACIAIDDKGACGSSHITAKVDPLVEGSYKIHVELRYGDGTPVPSEGGVLFDEKSVRFVPAPNCEPSDAAPDAAEAGEAGDAETLDARDAADAAVTEDSPFDSPADAPDDIGDEVRDAPDDGS